MAWKMPSKLKVEDLKAHQDLNLKASVDIFFYLLVANIIKLSEKS